MLNCAIEAAARSGRLVGRERELAAVRDALGRAAGGFAVLRVAGEPGIGKTRLLAELGHEAKQAGRRVLVGRASEYEGDVPYGAIVDALDPLVRTLDPQTVLRLGDRRIAELAAIFDSLRDDAAAAHALHPIERFRLHQAVVALLELVADIAPLVLVIDDAHWVDPASLELVAHLLRRPPDARVLLALAFRPGQAAGLVSMIATVDRGGLVVTADPAPLSDADARLLLGEGQSPAELEAFIRLSGGNPFYLEQLARSFPGRPLQAVAALLGSELAALDEEHRHAAFCASVAGDPFAPEELATAAGLSEEEALTAIDALIAADLIHETAAARRFRFRHPIVRSAAYDAAGTRVRTEAHRRMASALQQQGAPPRAIAHHLQHAAQAPDEEAAGVLATAAMEVYGRAPATAAAWLESALSLLGDNAPAQRTGLLLPLAQSLASIGELERCRDVLAELLENTPAIPGARAWIVVLMAMTDHMAGRYDRPRVLLEQTISELGDEQGAEATALRLQLASDLLYRGRYEEMVEPAREALELAERTGQPAALIAANAMVALSEYHLGNIEAALSHAAVSAEHLDETTDTELGFWVVGIIWLGWTEMFLEQPAPALAHLSRGEDIARAIGQTATLVGLMSGQAMAMFGLGRVVEGVGRAEEALDMALLANNTTWLATAAVMVGELLAGSPAAAVAHGEREIRAIPPDGRAPALIVHLYLAEAFVETGAPRRALDSLPAAAGGPGLPLFERALRPRAFETLASAALATGDVAGAGAWAARAAADAEGLGLGNATAAALRAQALVALGGGDASSAAGIARAAAEAASSPIDAARGGILAGRALTAAGDDAAAVTELEHALSRLEGTGAARLADEAAQLLRAHGQRVGRRRKASDRGALASLTERELEIADAIGAGRTNREIAASLFLSEKTVEKQVSSLLRKLGVTRRGAVASALAEARSR